MKCPYQEVLITKENGYKIQIRKTSLYFIVKIGKEGMKNYQKKANSERCYDHESLKSHLQQICSLHSIDYDSVGNQLNKALNPSVQVNVPSTHDSMVHYGGISKYYDYIYEQKLADTEKSRLYGLEIKNYNLA